MKNIAGRLGMLVILLVLAFGVSGGGVEGKLVKEERAGGSIIMPAQVPGTWVAGIQVMNLDTAAADVQIDFYDTAGTKVHTFTDTETIAAGAAKSYYVPVLIPDSVAATFNGSAVVSSSKRVAAVANQTASGISTTSGSRSMTGSYTGVSSSDAASTLYLPVAVKSYFGFESLVSIQNAGTADATVTLEFYDATGTQIAKHTTAAVKAGSSARVDLRDLTPNVSGSIPAGFNGAVKVTSSSALAAAVNNFRGTSAELQTYNGIYSGAKTLYVPGVYSNYYTFVSSIQVMNIGTADTSVTVTYSDGVSKNATVKPNSATLFLQTIEGHTELPGGVGWNGSATISSATSDIVAVVNQLSPVTGDTNANIQGNGSGAASSYNAFTGGGTSIVAPAVFNEYFGFGSAMTVMNVGTAATNVTVTYSDGKTKTVNNVQPGKSTQFFQFSKGIAASDPLFEGHAAAFSGSATIVSSAAAIAAVVNEQKYVNEAIPSTDLGDWQQSYNTIAR